MQRSIWMMVAAAGLAAGLTVALTVTGEAHRIKTPARQLMGPEVVLDLHWGRGADEIGRLDGQEAASEGPMSFDVTAAGDIYILDQVNRRVLKFGPNGVLERTLELPLTTFQDIVVYEEGIVVVVDRLVRRSLLVLEDSGHVLGEYSVVGEGVPEGGAITALFAQEDGVWLEIGHAHMVRVLDEWLEPCVRKVLPGRSYDPGRVIVGSALDGQGGVGLWLEDVDDGTIFFEREVVFEHRIARIAWVETDPDLNIVAFFHLLEFDPLDVKRVTHDEIVGVVFDRSLKPISQVRSPHVITQWEQFREFKVAPDSSVYQLVVARSGVQLLRWTWSW